MIEFPHEIDNRHRREVIHMATTTLSVKDVAEEIGTTPRLLRKFIRAEAVEAGGKVGEDTPGKGGRYSFTPEEAEALRERYEAALEVEEADETDESEELEDEEAEDYESEDDLELED